MNPFPRERKDYPIGGGEGEQADGTSLSFFSRGICTVRFTRCTHARRFSNFQTHTHETSIHAHAKLRAHTYARVRGCPDQPPTRTSQRGCPHTDRTRANSATGFSRGNVNRNSLARAANAIPEPALASRYTITRRLNRPAGRPIPTDLDRPLGPRSRTARRATVVGGRSKPINRVSRET